MYKQYSLKNTNMLLTYYGSPVCAKYSVISPVPLIRLTEKAQMSEHVRTSQGPQKPLRPQGVNYCSK